MNIKELIANKDYEGIKQALTNDPALANEGMPYDEKNTTKAHPLHRICDAVFINIITDEEGVAIAKIFLEHGAKVNGNTLVEKKDTPLLAAASLHADKVALLYIANGAVINHAGCHGGTALHWAAWCGRDKLISPLLQAGAEINKRCIDFNATPLFWAVHGLKSDVGNNLHDYLACVKILIEAGADKSIPNGGGKTVFDLLEDNDAELKQVLSQ